MTAISPEQLVARLAKGKSVPAVLLVGSDSYLRESCRARIVELAVEPGARLWGVQQFSAAGDELGLGLSHARMMPMLSPRQVVIVTGLEAIEEQAEKKREASVDDLAAYLASPAPFTVLVLEAGALDQRTKLAKLLAEKALVVAAELPSEPEERLRVSTTLALEMARERGVLIEGDAAEELADLCNGDLAAIRTELEKLSTYSGPGQTIRRADVETLVVSERKYSVWEFADVLATRQRARAFAFLDNLLREGEAPPGLVGAMAWMYRKLLEAQELGPRTSPGQAAGRLGMKPKMAEMALRQAQKIPRQQLVAGLRALYDADSRLKSGAKDERAVMEFLVAQLAGNSEPTARGA